MRLFGAATIEGSWIVWVWMTICLLKTVLSAGELKMPKKVENRNFSIRKMYWNMMMLLISSGSYYGERSKVLLGEDLQETVRYDR